MADAFSLRGVMSLETTKFASALLGAEKAIDSFAFKSKKAFRDASKLVGNFSSSISNSGKAISTQAAYVAALGAAFVVASSKAFAAADAIKDLAGQSGSSAEEIQKLAFAAKSLGAGDELSGALIKIAKASVAAKDGSSAAVDAFAKLGISVDQLAGKRADQIFFMIADGAKATDDPLKRTVALQELLGRGAVNLSLEMSAGAQAFRDLGEEASRAGIILSDSIISAASDANDKLGAMRATIEAGLIKVMAQLGPYFTVAADRLRSFVAESGPLGSSVAPAISKVANFIGVLADGIRGLEIVWGLAKASAIGFAAGVNTVLSGVIITINNVVNSINSGVVAALQGVVNIARKVGLEFESFDATIIHFNKTIASNDALVSGLASTTAGLTDSYNEAKEAAHNLSMQELPSEKIKAYIRDVEALKVAHQEASAAAGAGTVSGDSIGGVVTQEAKVKKEKARGVTKEKLIPNEALEEANRDLEEFSSSIHATLSGSFSAAFEGDFAGVRDMWKNMLSQMVVDSMAADLMGIFGLGTGGGKSTGQSFFDGAAGFFGSGGGVTQEALGGGARDGGRGSVLSQVFNITTKNPDSFQTARGRISSDTARGISNGG